MEPRKIESDVLSVSLSSLSRCVKTLSENAHVVEGSPIEFDWVEHPYGGSESLGLRVV
jgi:hypothetical protein